MRRDYDRVGELRAQRAASACSQTRERAEFAGFFPETFSIRCRFRSFFGPRTRAARISLTLPASATACAFIFCAANLPRANRSHPHRRDFADTKQFFNDHIFLQNLDCNVGFDLLSARSVAI